MKIICSWVEAPPTWEGQKASIPAPHRWGGSPPLSAVSLVSVRSCLHSFTKKSGRGPHLLRAREGAGSADWAWVDWLGGGAQLVGSVPALSWIPAGVRGECPGRSCLSAMAPRCRAQSPACRPVLTTIGSPLRRWKLERVRGSGGRLPAKGTMRSGETRGVDSGNSCCTCWEERGSGPAQLRGWDAAEARRRLGHVVALCARWVRGLGWEGGHRPGVSTGFQWASGYHLFQTLRPIRASGNHYVNSFLNI